MQRRGYEHCPVRERDSVRGRTGRTGPLWELESEEPDSEGTE